MALRQKQVVFIFGSSLTTKQYVKKRRQIMRSLLSVIVMALFISGCSTYAANRYSISVDNVTALKTLTDKQINVGQFTATKPGLSEIMCRGVGPIKSPDGETFENYIRKAFIDELKLAELYSVNSSVTLTGNLDNIDFSSNSGTWNLAATIKSTNGKVVTVSENYSYTTSFYGETACNQTAQALMPAVQDLISKIIRHPDFPTLVEARQASN
jgi:hypothetical protein